MFRSALFVTTLLASLPAHADVDACFVNTDGNAPVGMRTTYAPNWWTVIDLETDSAGCVTVPTTQRSVGITVHATNRVVMMVEGGLEVVSQLTVSNGGTYTLTADHTTAENARRLYEEGLRGFGPFTGSSPIGGTLHGGPYISADLGSWMVMSLPYVEPVPGWAIPPRVHLLSSNSSGSTLAHEMAHALHISQLPLPVKNDLEVYYIGWLMGENNTHTWSSPSTDVVAYVEAFGGVGETFENIGTGSEADFLTEAETMSDHLTESGDPTIEGVVYGVLFDAYATRMGLDFVISSYIDCEVLTLEDYSQCIEDRHGSSSPEFVALREAAAAYSVKLTNMPAPWDWDYCGGGFLCADGEGDCDSDSDCAAGTSCFHDVGSYYGESSAMDVCETTNGDWDKCSPDKPCRVGNGDCDTNSDCVFGAYCAQNTGASWGLGSTVDVCETTPYFITK